MATRALVVGGTNGIGYAMACRIAAEAKSSVVISGRTKPDLSQSPNIEFKALDASSMKSIKEYTDGLKSAQDQPKLDLLVLSQGILSMAGRTETSEGIDRKMALHYYGRQLLIRELTPILKDDAKIIIVLDGLRGSPSKLNWKDLDLKTHFSIANAASHCISMTDAMVQYYAAEQKEDQGGAVAKRHYVHAYPGFVKTSIGRELPWYLKPAAAAAGTLLATSPDTCAQRLLEGTYKCTQAGQAEGRFWSSIDEKGHLIPNKAIWTDEQLKTVADHTWKIVDDAISQAS
ncbi:hypothetical protein BX600DRAFT_505560 [Xylariales sp. PMI_506]|nr:hypothetical protein BX600DRAFT_505560 [Xylariales sp. PMI_506]